MPDAVIELREVINEMWQTRCCQHSEQIKTQPNGVGQSATKCINEWCRSAIANEEERVRREREERVCCKQLLLGDNLRNCCRRCWGEELRERMHGKCRGEDTDDSLRKNDGDDDAGRAGEVSEEQNFTPIVTVGNDPCN